jgi:acyl-CoA dehydrogenase
MTLTFEMSKPLADYGRVLREWSVDSLRPHARQADTDHLPPNDWREIMATCPVPVGSPYVRDGEATPTFEEGPWITKLVIYDNVSYGDVWAIPRLGNGIGHLVVQAMGTPEQVEKWYDPVVNSSTVTGFALTEPGFGSDTSLVSTTATRDGDTWVLNGSKIYCTQGAECEYAVVFATVDKSAGAKGINAFVVPAGTPGFHVVKPNEDKLGITSWSTSELLFDNCVVPVDNRLGYDAQGNHRSALGGQAGALSALSTNRPNMSMMAIGVAEASIDIAESMLRGNRDSFRPDRWSTIENDLARMRLAIERGRRVCLYSMHLVDQGRADRMWPAIGKGYPPQTCERVIRRCMQLLGPEGVSKDLLLEKWYRDVKIMDIFEGSGQIQRIIVGRTLMGRAAG